MAFVEHIKIDLLLERNFPDSKFNDQRILVWLFIQAMTDSIQNFNC